MAEIDPTRIATVGHAMKDHRRSWARESVRMAYASLTDAEIRYFPRHIVSGLVCLRELAIRNREQPFFYVLMAHNVPGEP